MAFPCAPCTRSRICSFQQNLESGLHHELAIRQGQVCRVPSTLFPTFWPRIPSMKNRPVILIIEGAALTSYQTTAGGISGKQPRRKRRSDAP